LLRTHQGQGGRDNVAGVTIPVKLSGALDNPNWNVELLGAAGYVAGRPGAVTETVKKGASGVRRRGVRGLKQIDLALTSRRAPTPLAPF